ncbi:hypothetical protein VCHC42A1_3074, partial [Vibrio cholerae HC-42A1]
MAFPVP